MRQIGRAWRPSSKHWWYGATCAAVWRPASPSTLVFGLSAYLPATEESLVYWAGLSVVLAAGVAGLVTAVLVGRAVIRRTSAVHDIERGRRSRRPGRCVRGSAAGSSWRWRHPSSGTVPTPASGSRSRWSAAGSSRWPWVDWPSGSPPRFR